MSATVLTALSHAWESRMVALLDGLPGVVVGRRCVDLADLLAAASAGHGDVAVVSADLRGLDRDAVRHLRAHGVSVVGASPDGAEEPERHLRRLGIERHVHLASPPEDVVDALSAPREGEPAADLLTSEPADRTPAGDVPDAGTDARGRVVAVWGPIGAPGRSILAINLAAEIAAAGTSTVLLDLDTYGASVAQLLSVLDEAPGLAAAARASEQGSLDLPGLARLAVEVAPGFRVLTGIPTPSRWTEVRAAAVEHVVDLARSLAEIVVIDCGFGIEDDEELSYDTLAPRRNATTLTALGLADDLHLVGAADPVGLQRMVRAVQEVGRVPAPPPRPVVNRLRASAVGSDPQRRVGEALARFAGLEEIDFLPEDGAAADTALLAGATLLECAPESPLRLAIARVAATYTGQEPPRRSRTRRRLLTRV